MKITTIVTDAAINFADCEPQVKEIMLDAFEKIYTHENITDGDSDNFEVYYSNDEPTNNFGGAFITSIYGTYLLHDIRDQQVVCDEDNQFECTVLYYSLSKLSDIETIVGVLTAPAAGKSALEDAIDFATKMVEEQKY